MTTSVTDLAGVTTSSPLGRLTLVSSTAGLRAVLWPDDRPGRVPAALGARVVGDDEAATHRHLAAGLAALEAYFAGDRMPTVELDLVGTPFQLAVWQALRAIPTGTTCSYGELAAAVGRPGAARAVGSAVGRNPVSVLVPCHRVVGSSGALTGFAGGLPAKRWLLAHESGAASSVAAERRWSARVGGRP